MPTLTYKEQTSRNVTDACHRDGNYCDGTNDMGEDGVCACGCHSLYAPIFGTFADVREYHLPASTYRPATDADGPNVRRIETYDGTLYVLREQYRQ